MISKNVFTVMIAAIITIVAFFFTGVVAIGITQIFPIFHAGNLVGFVEELNGLGNFVVIAAPIAAGTIAGYFMYRAVSRRNT